MNEVFADTSYWIAVTIPDDKWAEAALRAELALPPDTRIVTTEEVLSEFLGWVSVRRERFRHHRSVATSAVRAILLRPDVIVLQQTHQTFLAGLELYERRPGSDYSLVDCASMAAMRERGIAQALTSDRHFEQEGFAALMLNYASERGEA